MTTKRKRVLFEALVRQTADTLHLYLTACTTDAALADEVFQDTIVVAWQRMGDFDPKRSFGAWTRGIARNILLAKRRERYFIQRLDEEVLVQIDNRVGVLEKEPGDTLDEKLACLNRCLEELSERDRSAIDARYKGGLRGAELAERLQTSLDNARKIVQRARAKLQACMKTKLAWD